MTLTLEQMSSLEAEILKRVRVHPGISRIELAGKLRIAPSTVGNYVGRLMSEGFLTESLKTNQEEAGRPPTELRLNPDGGQFIGVDFDARNMMAMAVDFSDRPLRHSRQDIHKTDSVPEVIAKIEEAITEVLPDNQSRLLAIGIGVPGLVDPVKGIAIDYKYINSWRNVGLAAPLAKRFGVPVYLENTIRSMALAELWFGQGRGVSDWLCIGIRSGIGAGIVAGGQLQRGSHYQAGEIGRWRCELPSRPRARFFAGDDPATATNLELQEIASARAMLAALERARQANEKTILSAQPGPLAFTDIVRAAQQRDGLTIEIIRIAAEMLGGAVGQLVLALNPSSVILTGPLTLLGDTLLSPLRIKVEEMLAKSGVAVPSIVNSSMGEYSGALGAAALAVHEWKPVRV